MTGIRRFFTIAHRDDRGLGLPEMLVAMVIFALVSTGVLYGLLAMLQLSRESRATQVASNLAAEEIDLVRDVDDVFSLVDATRTVELNGDTYEVRRIARWVSDPATDLECGSGGQPLRYKRVAVEVRWQGMRDDDNPVSSFTLLNPDERINDPALGTILVNVVNGAGTGLSGVVPSAAPANPANGAQPLAGSARPTDAQGCSYLLKVRPGNYNVSLNLSNHVSADQEPIVTKFVQVAAGAAASASFLYDRSARFDVRYLASVPTGGPAITWPPNFSTTFISTYGTHQASTVPNSGSRVRSFNLFPFASGYEVFAGSYVAPSDSDAGCVAPDPAAWEPRVEGDQTFVGVRPGPVAAVPGGSASIDVPMGLVDVRVGNAGTVRVVSVDGTPRCAVPTTYTYNRPAGSRPDNMRLALPFGNWQIFTGTSSTPIPDGNITLLTLGSVAGGILTLDPRTVPQP